MTHSFDLLIETLRARLNPRPGTLGAPPTTKIDAVYLWKDDSDADWIARKRAFIDTRRDQRRYNASALSDVEIRPQLDELRFSLRSLEQHFLDLGNVYLVTDGQLPDWLDTAHAKLRLVDVADLVDEHYLPTYNSQAIESYLYTLEGLSEHFVYFNDDFFLTKPVSSSSFFPTTDTIWVRLGRALSAKGGGHPREDADTSALKNANRFLDTMFRPDIRLTIMHRPYALTRALYKDLYEQLPEAFLQTRSSQLRSTEMVAIHSQLLPYWAYYQGRAKLIAPQLFTKDMYYLNSDPEKNKGMFDRIRSSNDIGFCIQGTRGDAPNQATADHFKAEMTKLYPEPSSFERS